MIFYPRYVADLQKKTSQFSMLERGALEPLLDHLYIQETPYIESFARAVIIAKANSKAEKAAVRYVLDQCFELVEGGRYLQKRASIEIPKALTKIKAAQENGRLGGRPKQPTGLPNGLPDRLPSGLPIGLSNQNQNQNQTIASLHLVSNNNNDIAAVPAATGQNRHEAATSDKAGSCSDNDTGVDYSQVVFPKDAEMCCRPAFEGTCRKLKLTQLEANQLGQELLARIAASSAHPELRILHIERWLEAVVKNSRSSGQQILRAGIEYASKSEKELSRAANEITQAANARAEADAAQQRTEKTVAVISCAGENQLQLIVDRAASLLPPTSRTRFEAVLRDSVLQRKIPTGVGGSAVKRAVEELGLMSMVGQ